MSNLENDKLIEDAMELLEEVSGTALEKIMLRNIEVRDLEALYHNMTKARAMLREDEYTDAY